MSNVADLLQKTSRTFAVTIPFLPEPTRQEVSVAYLVFRIVDTFEDGTRWSAERRCEVLGEIRHLLETPDPQAARLLADRCLQDPPTENANYRELLGEIPFVFERCAELRPAAAALVRSHAAKTATGMAGFVARTAEDGVLRLQSVEELRDYCYVVAGVVGEMLTELFLLGRPEIGPQGPYLRERARAFGEALQLVNILKDAGDDAAESRLYLPARVPRAEIFTLARADLARAAEYSRALFEAGAPRGLVGFNLLLVRLATRTLAVVRDRGAGAKLSRPEVVAIVAGVAHELDEGRPLFPVEDAAGASPA
jgi:farnesyl-diphosphate farnesyltransferase